MNDEYLRIEGRVFVKSSKGLREVKDEKNLSNKLGMENLSEVLFERVIWKYSCFISDLKTKLHNKKRRLEEARKQSGKKAKRLIIIECLFAPILSFLLTSICAYTAGTTDKWYDFLGAFIDNSSVTLSSTIGMTAALLTGIFLLQGVDYIIAKRDIKALEKEIPSLEQEISDRQKEKVLLEERSKHLETTTLEHPQELHSLSDYNQKLTDSISERFHQIEDLKDIRKTLQELFQADELDDIMGEAGFTKEEATVAKSELAKRFYIQQK